MFQKIITGAIVGATIGAASAFLFGTKQGKTVRKQAGEVAENTWEDVEDIFSVVIDKIDDYLKQRK